MHYTNSNSKNHNKRAESADHAYTEKKSIKKRNICAHILDFLFFTDDNDALEPTTDSIKTKCTSIMFKSIFLLILSAILFFFAAYEVTMNYANRTTTTVSYHEEKKSSVNPDEILASEKKLLSETCGTDYYNTASKHLSCYAYNTLNVDSQKIYIEIYETIINFGEFITLNTLNEDTVATVYEAVLADHGELFWVNGYSVRSYMQGKKIIQLDFFPMYTMNKSKTLEYKECVDAAVSDILKDAPIDGSTFDKLKFVYDYLAKNVTYNVEAIENQNILSVFLYQETVCQGYAASLQYLLRELGIPSTIITGTLDNLSHAWNLVCLDGDYYYIDATAARIYLENTKEYIVDYSYFAVTTDDIYKRYVADDSFELPNCDSKKYNYFIKNGLFFSEFNPSAIGNIYKNALENDEMVLSIRFSSSNLLKQVRNYFINDGHIYEYCGTKYTIYYIENQTTNILTIRFK